VPSIPDITESGTTSDKIKINIKENVANALKEYTDSVKLTLPKGFSWILDDRGDGYGTILNVTNGTVDPDVYYTVSERHLYVVCNDTSGKYLYRIYAGIDVDATEAKLGEVKVTVGGRSSSSPSSLVVAEYVDYGVTIEAKDAPDVLAGRLEQEVGDIVIKELSGDSLVGGRTIILTLPKKAKFNSYNLSSEGGIAVDTANLNTDLNQLKIKLAENGTSAGKIKLEDVTVDLAIDISAGDLVIEASGSAGVEGKITVAKVLAPITVTANEVEVKIGVKDQAAGDITITEAQAEALIKDGEILIEAPSGVSWATTPTVTVTEGDLDLGTVQKDGRCLYIPIDSESSTASTIKISNVKFTVDRTVPEGTIELKIGGDALNESASVFTDSDWAAKVVNAVCVTPAPGETKVTAVLKVGDTVMKVNDAEVTMDAAPYIKNSRLYVSARFCANAFGVPDSNIIRDNASKTATIMAGARVIVMKVGSNVMYVNGAAITMDTAPELAPPGRVMLPIGWLALALGAKADWNQEAQTATLEL
jgi:hypothetical protein